VAGQATSPEVTGGLLDAGAGLGTICLVRQPQLFSR